MDSAPKNGRNGFCPYGNGNGIVNKMAKYNPDIHHRRSIRLKGYDYSQAGLYFVTICCQNKLHLFGKIDNGIMVLNDAGKMFEKIWHEIPNNFENIHLHEYITMPNHIHGIIEITVGADSISAPVSAKSVSAPKRAEMDSAPTKTGTKRAEMDSAPTPPPQPQMGLSRIVQSFKRHTTIEYIKMVK